MKRRHVKKMVRRGWHHATWRQRRMIINAEREQRQRGKGVSLWLLFAARAIEVNRAFSEMQRILRRALAA